jgi:hypothetical protein
MVTRRGYVATILALLVVILFIFRSRVKTCCVPSLVFGGSKKTVKERLEEYGPAARRRLLPYFRAAGVSYPPEKLALIGLKYERLLEIWASDEADVWKHIRSYPILGLSGEAGPKLREGDCQMPEGFYRIESLNPNSRFHLSLRLNYPNEFDRRHAKLDGRANPGSDIMIHGSNVSVGCLAMGNVPAEDLFVLCAETALENVQVILSPVDFRRTDFPPNIEGLPKWSYDLYAELKLKLSQFVKR